MSVACHNPANATERKTDMPLAAGDKVHVIERRHFDTDLRRHFVGVVEVVTEVAFRASGYVFVYDPGTSSYARLETRRTRIIPTSSAGIIINVVSPETDIEATRYDDSSGRLVVTDGGALRLDVNEFGRNR